MKLWIRNFGIGDLILWAKHLIELIVIWVFKLAVYFNRYASEDFGFIIFELGGEFFGWFLVRFLCLKYLIQVNLCQKHSFLNQLTHNMTTDCSLITDFSTRKIQVENMLCTKIVFCFRFGIQNNFCTQHVLNLYFSCTEVRNQWTICRHIVG